VQRGRFFQKFDLERARQSQYEAAKNPLKSVENSLFGLF